MAAHHGLLPPPEGPGYLGLPTNILLGLPLRGLSEPAFVAAWVLFDALCVVLAVALLFPVLEPLPALARAAAVAGAAGFPAVFAELAAGQRGGPLLLLAAVAIRTAGRPGVAGALIGAAASLKLYPGAMLLGLPRARAIAAAAAAAAVLVLAAFAPLGGPLFYLQHVLLPALQPSDADCGITSVRSLWMRLLGGEAYWWIGPGGGLVEVRSPIHLPLAGEALTVLTQVTLVATAVWTAWRRGFGTPYALAITFALGAVVPGEVFPYQYLPLLPLLVMLLAAGFRDRRWGSVIALAACLAAFLPPPCSIPFPNLWTLGGVGLFALGAASARTSR
jgi:hypothetical protein